MKVMVNRYKTLLIEEYPNEIRPYLKEHQTISIYWFYLLHSYVVMSTKSK